MLSHQIDKSFVVLCRLNGVPIALFESTILQQLLAYLFIERQEPAT